MLLFGGHPDPRDVIVVPSLAIFLPASPTCATKSTTVPLTMLKVFIATRNPLGQSCSLNPRISVSSRSHKATSDEPPKENCKIVLPQSVGRGVMGSMSVFTDLFHWLRVRTESLYNFPIFPYSPILLPSPPTVLYIPLIHALLS